jgi:hypothetical protein
MGQRVNDDLSAAGQQRIKQSAATGQRIMRQQQQNQRGGTSVYGFGSIEQLPGLPNEQEARQILATLSKDVGM